MVRAELECKVRNASFKFDGESEQKLFIIKNNQDMRLRIGSLLYRKNSAQR